MAEPEIARVNTGSGASHQNSLGNPDDGQAAEDSFAGGIASLLNKRVLDGEISDLIVIAAPRTLGELRKVITKSCQKYFAAKSLKTSPVMRCTK